MSRKIIFEGTVVQFIKSQLNYSIVTINNMVQTDESDKIEPVTEYYSKVTISFENLDETTVPKCAEVPEVDPRFKGIDIESKLRQECPDCQSIDLIHHYGSDTSIPYGYTCLDCEKNRSVPERAEDIFSDDLLKRYEGEEVGSIEHAKMLFEKPNKMRRITAFLFGRKI
jgi:hypothetical protein